MIFRANILGTDVQVFVAGYIDGDPGGVLVYTSNQDTFRLHRSDISIPVACSKECVAPLYVTNEGVSKGKACAVCPHQALHMYRMFALQSANTEHNHDKRRTFEKNAARWLKKLEKQALTSSQHTIGITIDDIERQTEEAYVRGGFKEE